MGKALPFFIDIPGGKGADCNVSGRKFITLTLSPDPFVSCFGITSTKGKEMTPLRMVIAVATMLGASHALAHGGLVDLSVYDRADGKLLPVYWHESLAYVVGK